MKNIVKWIIIIAIVALFVKVVMDFVNPKTTDISYLASMDKSEIESRLGFAFTENPDMIKKIYAYTDGEITVHANMDNDIAIVFIDGKQAGIHTDNRKYSMFGVHMGEAAISMEESITFVYDDSYTVLNDLAQGSSTANFYYNSQSNECFVIIVNDTTNRVVALTYYKDGKKATERLRPL